MLKRLIRYIKCSRREHTYTLRLLPFYSYSNWIIFNELFTFSNLKRHLFNSPIRDQGKQISDITFFFFFFGGAQTHSFIHSFLSLFIYYM